MCTYLHVFFLGIFKINHVTAYRDERAFVPNFTFYLGKAIPSIQSTGTTVTGVSARAVSALPVINLRRNEISTTSAIPTARLPTPSSANSFAYPAVVATAVVPVGSRSEERRVGEESGARPATSIQINIITP